jgi:hypothetical protein
VYFYAFDLLNQDGELLLSFPIERRRKLQAGLLSQPEDPLACRRNFGLRRDVFLRPCASLIWKRLSASGSILLTNLAIVLFFLRSSSVQAILGADAELVGSLLFCRSSNSSGATEVAEILLDAWRLGAQHSSKPEPRRRLTSNPHSSLLPLPATTNLDRPFHSRRLPERDHAAGLP